MEWKPKHEQSVSERVIVERDLSNMSYRHRSRDATRGARFLSASTHLLASTVAKSTTAFLACWLLGSNNGQREHTSTTRKT